MRVIIIEDEPLMADELAKEILEVDANITITGKFVSIKETIDHLSKNKLPDLFFSDIQLTDGLSFEIFSKLKKPVPVIFCTAFDEYALEAFKSNGIDYLLKPFDNAVIRETIHKYKHLIRNEDFTQDLSRIFEQINPNNFESKSLIIHQGQKMYPVKYADMRILYLKDGITYLITEKGRKHIISSSLDGMEAILTKDFFRVNRQFILHREAISHIDSYFARKLLVTTTFNIDMDIVVSKANAPKFLEWLESS